MGIERIKRPLLAPDILGVNLAGPTPDIGSGSGYLIEWLSQVIAAMEDSTTYYWGTDNTTFLVRASMTTAANVTPVIVPYAGTIKAVIVHYCEGTGAGTASDEAWTMNLNINDTTDVAIETISETGSKIRSWENYSLNQAVAQGDELRLKSTTPAWATNPLANVERIWVTIWIETPEA